MDEENKSLLARESPEGRDNAYNLAYTICRVALEPALEDENGGYWEEILV